MAWMTAAIALGAGALCGGWEWTLVCLIVMPAVWRGDSRAIAVLGAVAPGLCWLVLYRFTGDRRLFFPYAMQYAVQAGYVTGRPALRGGGVVLLFVGIRIAQGAAASILLVEILVAAGVLALPRRGGLAGRTTGAVLGSLVAFAGLAI